MKYLKLILIILVGILIISLLGGFGNNSTNNKKTDKVDPYKNITTDIYDVVIHSTVLGDVPYDLIFNEENKYDFLGSFVEIVNDANYEFNSLSYSLNEIDLSSGVTRNVKTYFKINKIFYYTIETKYDPSIVIDVNQKIDFGKYSLLNDIIDALYDMPTVYTSLVDTSENCYFDLVIEVEDIYKDEVINIYSEVFTLVI